MEHLDEVKFPLRCWSVQETGANVARVLASPDDYRFRNCVVVMSHQADSRVARLVPFLAKNKLK